MAKRTYKGTCPCEDYEFRIVYWADEPVREFYCPFCSSPIDDTPEPVEEED